MMTTSHIDSDAIRALAAQSLPTVRRQYAAIPVPEKALGAAALIHAGVARGLSANESIAHAMYIQGRSATNQAVQAMQMRASMRSRSGLSDDGYVVRVLNGNCIDAPQASNTPGLAAQCLELPEVGVYTAAGGPPLVMSFVAPALQRSLLCGLLVRIPNVPITGSVGTYQLDLTYQSMINGSSPGAGNNRTATYTIDHTDIMRPCWVGIWFANGVNGRLFQRELAQRDAAAVETATPASSTTYQPALTFTSGLSTGQIPQGWVANGAIRWDQSKEPEVSALVAWLRS